VASALVLLVLLVMSTGGGDASGGSSGGAAETLRSRLRAFRRGDPCAVGGAIKRGARWVTNGAIMFGQDLVISGDNVKPAISLAGSTLLSLRRVTPAEAKQHYLPKQNWVAEIRHADGEPALSTDAFDIGLIAVVLGWPSLPTVNEARY
jgi:hypothetical protein